MSKFLKLAALLLGTSSITAAQTAAQTKPNVTETRVDMAPNKLFYMGGTNITFEYVGRMNEEKPHVEMGMGTGQSFLPKGTSIYVGGKWYVNGTDSSDHTDNRPPSPAFKLALTHVKSGISNTAVFHGTRYENRVADQVIENNSGGSHQVFACVFGLDADIPIAKKLSFNFSNNFVGGMQFTQKHESLKFDNATRTYKEGPITRSYAAYNLGAKLEYRANKDVIFSAGIGVSTTSNKNFTHYSYASNTILQGSAGVILKFGND